jgi:hypothetical protein
MEKKMFQTTKQYIFSPFLEDPIFHKFWQLHFQTSAPCLCRQRADLFGHAAVLVPRQVERVNMQQICDFDL